MNPAIFSPCEAANICNSPSFSIHVSLATSAVLKPVIVFARKMQLSYNTELLLPNMGIFRKCFKAVMGMAVGPNHQGPSPSCGCVPTWAGSQTVPVPNQGCALFFHYFRNPESMNCSGGCNV